MSNKKKYDSTVSFQCKRLGQVQYAAGILFRESLLWIKVDHGNRIFIVYVDDKVNSDNISNFTLEFKQCKVIIFKEISLEELRNPSMKILSQ